MKTQPKKHECQNCGARLSDREIRPPRKIKDYCDRVAPGEIAPSGECRRCGALTHLIRPVGIVGLLYDAVVSAEDCLASLVDASNPKTENERATLAMDREALKKVRDAIEIFTAGNKKR